MWPEIEGLTIRRCVILVNAISYYRAGIWQHSFVALFGTPYSPLLKYTTFRSGFFFLMPSWTSASNWSTLMDARWLYSAQHSGVANVKHKPQNRVWIGALAQGNRFNTPFFSRKVARIGVNNIPGVAMLIRLSTTAVIPWVAAVFETPIFSLFSSNSSTPCWSSLKIRRVHLKAQNRRNIHTTERPLTGSSSSGCWCNWQQQPRPTAPDGRSMAGPSCTAGSRKGP